MHTLITAANSSEAYNLKGKLQSSVLLGDYMELPALLIQSGKVLKLPDPENPAYTHQMLALCLDKDIDTIYALRAQEIELLLIAEQLFNEYEIQIKGVNDKI